MDRTRLIQSMVPTDGRKGLEIGPSYQPLFPKRDGFNVETVDYISRDELIEKYARTENVDVNAIEDVDYVCSAHAIFDTIKQSEKYDYIVASHVVEHVPDLILFINQCGNLLKHDGVLFLAIPDKRYCFDLIQPLTATGDVVDAHLRRDSKPSPGKVFDSIAYDVLRGRQIGWDSNCTSKIELNATLLDATRLLDLARTTTQYIDVHCWRFLPSSFRLIINDLHELQLINMREQSFQTTDTHEFYALLSKCGSGSSVSRQTLAERIAYESPLVRI